MKLSRLYSNLPDIFVPIDFENGFNAVVAEIHLPENKTRDTHNLGKTTLGRLIDFTLLKSRHAELFLFKHEERFKRFVFFLELELSGGSFLTVRRGVQDNTKISFLRHSEGRQDYSQTPEEGWDHSNIPFERSLQLLDGLLDWRGLKPWPYRKGIGYLLRSQGDFQDVFKLARFAGKHGQWKPFLAHVLGFNSEAINTYYETQEALDSVKNRISTLESELGGSVEDLSKIEGMLLIGQREAQRRREFIDQFDFRGLDKRINTELVDSLDVEIATLNQRRYYLTTSINRIRASLQDEQILFDPAAAQTLFAESRIVFEGQVKRDFEQLISFNRAITEERRKYLTEELRELEVEVATIEEELAKLGQMRAEALRFLSDSGVLDKYRSATKSLAVVEAEVISLRRQRDGLDRLKQLRSEERQIAGDARRLQESIEEDVESQSSNQESVFSAIRLFFNEIIEEVISRRAILTVVQNKQGNLDFRVEILGEEGESTSADVGATYRKLLCIAFDLAVLRAHLSDRYPQFVFHDGAFETLDSRKKERLLAVFRKYAEIGIQSVVTLIDSDMPRDSSGEPMILDREIILKLHDRGQDGRLFRMDSW